MVNPTQGKRIMYIYELWAKRKTIGITGLEINRAEMFERFQATPEQAQSYLEDNRQWNETAYLVPVL